MLLSCLMVVVLVLSSCQTATTEETKEGTTVTGKVTEKESSKVEDKDETKETVTEEAKPEMVLNVRGELVEKPVYGGTVTGIRVVDPISWDPFIHQSGDYSQHETMGSVYEMFLGGNLGVDPGEFPFRIYYIPPRYSRGYLLESWESPDPSTYIVHLREGIRFQDKAPVNGRELTADDVKYCIDRWAGKGEHVEHGHSTVAMGTWALLDEVEVIDRYTAKITLTEPCPVFTENWGAAEYMPWIYPREVVDTYGDDFSWENVVALGPWTVEDVVPGSSVTFYKNENYWGWDERFPEGQFQLPYADRFVQLLIQDPNTGLAALRTGKVDMYRGVNWQKALSLQESNPELQYQKFDSVALAVFLRCDLEPWSDVRVRKAMQMAIDLESLVKDYYGGTGVLYPELMGPSFKDQYTPFEELPEETQEGFIYNPEGAKALLAEAGYPNGFSQTISLSSTTSVEGRELNDIFISYWEEIGITTDIKFVDAGAFTSYLQGAQQELWWSYTARHWLPIDALQFVYSKTWYNFGKFADPKVDQLFEEARRVSMSEQAPILKELVAYGTGQFPCVAAPIKVEYYFWQPWLKGYEGYRRVNAISTGGMWARMWTLRK